MTASLYINDEFRIVRIECADDEPTIWVRAGFMGDDTVSLSLSPANLDALEAAIQAARALQAVAA